MRVALTLALLFAWGCDGSCIRNSDCPGMLVCMAGACAMPIVEMDADIPDGEPGDTAGLDAGVDPDAAVDASELDGALDAGAMDAPSADTAETDAAEVDADMDASDMDVGTDGGSDGGSDAT